MSAHLGEGQKTSNRPDWQEAPEWAQWAAMDVLSGNWYYFAYDKPCGTGWVYVQARPKVARDTIKELSGMCFNSEPVDHAAELAGALECCARALERYDSGHPNIADAVIALTKYKQPRGEG